MIQNTGPSESAVDKAHKMFHFNAQGAGKKKKFQN